MEKIIYNMKKYNFELAKSSSRNTYNNKHFSARSIGNNGGRQQMNSYSVRGRTPKFENNYINNNLNINNNDDNSFE